MAYLLVSKLYSFANNLTMLFGLLTKRRDHEANEYNINRPKLILHLLDK